MKNRETDEWLTQNQRSVETSLESGDTIVNMIV